jgi:outer membrane protein assembly factor BamD (BamD/ComL family)
MAMSILGISSSLVHYNPQSVQSNFQNFQKDFQQLGQDLQAGNLAGAQSDFATLQHDVPSAASSTSSQNSSPIVQAFSQLAKDLQFGNISGAQQDFSTIQQDFQSQAAQPHHHHRGGEGAGAAINQLLNQLGQNLQSGNLASAQQAYSVLAKDFQQLAPTEGAQPQSPLIPLSTNVSVSS